MGEIPIDRPPLVSVKEGQVVRIDTLSHQGATQDQDPIAYLGGMGVKSGEVLQDVVDFWKSRSSRPREGRAGHILTGPVYSAEALALASVGCDFHVAEAVDLTQVIVGKIPKSVFRSTPRK